MNTVTIKCLEEYIRYIITHSHNFAASKTFFYRGMSSATFQLLPSVFRNDLPESDLCHNFRDRGNLRDVNLGFDELDSWLFLMQHHGLPTRLLDWSESPLVALHFAVHNNAATEDAVVYILNPTDLNRLVLGDNWFPDRNDNNYKYRFVKSFYTSPKKLPWKIDLDFEYVTERKLPLAIRPILHHSRMIAQESVFTIHGDNKNCILEILQEIEQTSLLTKLILPRGSIGKINYALIKCGVGRASIFPDLDGISEDIVSKTKSFLGPLRK